MNECRRTGAKAKANTIHMPASCVASFFFLLSCRFFLSFAHTPKAHTTKHSEQRVVVPAAVALSHIAITMRLAIGVAVARPHLL